MHLKDDELVDLAEAAQPESSAPHLSSCGECRRQLGDMRALMSAVADVEVPEPSPLYWDHLSARVRHSVATEPPPRAWRDIAAWRRVPTSAWAAAVASIIIVAAVSSRLTLAPPAPAPAATAAVRDNEVVDLWNDRPTDGDESLTLVASLSDGLDLEAAGEAGLMARGSAEHAVTHMDDDDLRELQRLLTQELTAPGIRPPDPDHS